MDALQRDGMPWGDEPATGSCWNCGHAAQVCINGKWYDLCAKERDENASGDLEIADDSTRNCEGWVDYAA